MNALFRGRLGLQRKIFSPLEQSAEAEGIELLERRGNSFISQILGSPRKRRSAITLALAVSGGLILAFSYFSSSVVATFIGLSLILWSVISFYATDSLLVPEEVFKATSLASMASVQTVVGSLGYKGRFIYFHPRSLEGMKRGFVFIAKDGDTSLPSEAQQTTSRMFFDKPEGVLMPAPSQYLIDLIEKKIGRNLATMDFNELAETIPRILTEDLTIADSVEMEQSDREFDVAIAGKLVAGICATVRDSGTDSKHFGCPICTTFALIISKVISSPVVIEHNTGTKDSIRTSFKRLET